MEVSFLSRGAGSSSAFPDRPLRARFSEFVVTSCTRVVAGTPVRRRNQRNDGYGIGNDIRADSYAVPSALGTRDRGTGANTHARDGSGCRPSPRTVYHRTRHVTCHAPAGPRVRPSRTAALDRRPRRTTPHHVADHSQEQSSPHNHLPTVFAPHETKTQKPGAVTLVIVPQTAGMPHRPL